MTIVAKQHVGHDIRLPRRDDGIRDSTQLTRDAERAIAVSDISSPERSGSAFHTQAVDRALHLVFHGREDDVVHVVVLLRESRSRERWRNVKAFLRTLRLYLADEDGGR